MVLVYLLTLISSFQFLTNTLWVELQNNCDFFDESLPISFVVRKSYEFSYLNTPVVAGFPIILSCSFIIASSLHFWPCVLVFFTTGEPQSVSSPLELWNLLPFLLKWLSTSLVKLIERDEISLLTVWRPLLLLKNVKFL